MPRRRDATLATAVAMLLLSLGVHLVGWAVGEGIIRLDWGKAPLPRSKGAIEVSLLDPPKKPDDVEKKNPAEPPGKLVQVDRVSVARPPQETNQVSEFDNTVARETVARGRRSDQPGDPVPPQEGAQKPSPAKGSERAQASPSDVQALALGAFRGAVDDRDSANAQSNPAELAADGTLLGPAGRQGGAGSPSMRGGVEAMRRTFGGARSSLEDVDAEDGDETMLNSKRWRFASFFNRVRDAVAKNWHPEPLHQANDPYNKVYGTRSRLTRLEITLNPDGSLKRVGVQTASGVDYLDEEAIRAVRSAQPFSNPPPQLVGPEGTIDFTFGFLLEIGGRSKIFRYQR